LAKERFDLAIKARKALQEQIAALEQKARQDQEALKKLTEVKPPAAPEPSPRRLRLPGRLQFKRLERRRPRRQRQAA
jgi:hypothetical protein